MTSNPLLPTWAAIVAHSVIAGRAEAPAERVPEIRRGTIGHRLTQPAGPAHPQGHAPRWVTARGVDLQALHAAHSALVVHDRRGEDRECQVGKIHHVKPRRRVVKGNVVPIRRTA
jgi:hypothetical protein